MNKQSIYMLLPTEKESPIWITANDGKAHFGKSEVSRPEVISQFIYILSDDEIKEEEWWYCPLIKNISQAFSKKDTLQGLPHRTSKKIIATTNPELWDIKQIDKQNYGIPSISRSDIEYIISLYNGKDKGIDIKKLANESFEKNGHLYQDKSDHIIGFDYGYKKCLEKNADKKFTLEDLAYVFGRAINCGLEHGDPDEVFARAIQFLTKEQPQTNTVMVEYEEIVTMPREHLLTGSDIEVGARKNPVFRAKLMDGHITIIRE